MLALISSEETYRVYIFRTEDRILTTFVHTQKERINNRNK